MKSYIPHNHTSYASCDRGHLEFAIREVAPLEWTVTGSYRHNGAVLRAACRQVAYIMAAALVHGAPLLFDPASPEALEVASPPGPSADLRPL